MRIGQPRASSLIALALAVSLVGASRSAEPQVVVVVSQRSDVTALTRDQVADLFLGKATRLPGGTKAKPLDHPEGSRLREAFYSEYAGKSPAQMKAHWARIIFTGRGQPPAEVPDSQAALRQVAEEPGAISYVERSQVDASVRVVAE